jgi:hypothetical protein
VIGSQLNLEEFVALGMERAWRSDTVVGHVIEDHVFSRARGEIVDGLENLVGDAMPLECGMKRNYGIVSKRGGNQIAIRRRRGKRSGVHAMRQLPNATLALQTVQHIQDGTAMRIPCEALSSFLQGKQRRGLSKVGEGDMWIHGILT